MKLAAEEAAEIIAHYIDAARSGAYLHSADRLGEIEGVMQGLIDEATTEAKKDSIAHAKLFLRVRGDIEKLRIEMAALRRELPPQLFNEPVQGGSCTPLIKVPDEPAPLGPMCARPRQQAPKIAGVQQLLPGSMCLQASEETEHLPSDRLSHIYNCKFCEQILLERGE